MPAQFIIRRRHPPRDDGSGGGDEIGRVQDTREPQAASIAATLRGWVPIGPPAVVTVDGLGCVVHGVAVPARQFVGKVCPEAGRTEQRQQMDLAVRAFAAAEATDVVKAALFRRRSASASTARRRGT